MVNWNGIFLPLVTQSNQLVKHVQSVTFRPLREMTSADWDVLDWPELRPVPRRRIQEEVINGTLEGFHLVDIDMHKVHGGKPRYLWPGREGQELDLGAGALEGWEKDVEPLQQYEDEEAELDSRSQDELRSELAIRYGFDRGQIVLWPTWAVKMTLLALRYSEDGNDGNE